MRFDFWKIINWIFWVSTTICIVYFITNVNWKDIETINLLRDIGVIGGLMYFSDYFWKEINNNSSKTSKTRCDDE